MSDSASKTSPESGEKTTTAAVEGAPGTAVTTPEIDMAAISAAATESALTALRAEQKQNTGDKDLAKKLEKLEADSEARNKRLMAALTGEEEKPDINALTRELLTNTPGVLEGTIDLAVERAVAKIQSNSDFEKSQKQAAIKVIKERPDIAGNDGAKAMVELLFKHKLESGEDKTSEEAMTEAVREYDLQVEKLGLGNREDRIAAAGSLSSTSSASMSSGTSKGGAASLADAAQVDQDWLQERREKDKKRRGL